MKILTTVLFLLLAFGCNEESENVSTETTASSTQTSTTPTCSADGVTCTFNSQCCSNTCNSTTNQCESTVGTCSCDRTVGQTCGTGSTGGNPCGNCCVSGLTCNGGICESNTPTCTANGVACTQPSDCCSNNCSGGFCQTGSGTGTGSQPGTGSTTGSSTNKCWDMGDDVGLPYYVLPMIGMGGPNAMPSWSSPEDITASNATEQIFVTDSRLHIRVLTKPEPLMTGECTQIQRYGELSLVVGIRGRQDTNYVQTIQFNRIKVNECSEVMRFTNIPTNNPTSPFIVEILNVEWDVDCATPGFGAEGCNVDYMKPVWGNGVPNPTGQFEPGNPIDACWNIELHVSTDATRDIPR